MQTMYHVTESNWKGHTSTTIYTDTTDSRTYVCSDEANAEKLYRRAFNLQRVPFHHVYMFNGFVTFEK